MVIQGLHIYERDYAFNEHEKKDGSIVQNCADLVADILSVNDRLIISKPKIKKGSMTRRSPYIWRFLGVDILFKKGVVSPINTEVTWPNKQFEDFSNENSGGIIELPQ